MKLVFARFLLIGGEKIGGAPRVLIMTVIDYVHIMEFLKSMNIVVEWTIFGFKFGNLRLYFR